MSKSITTIQIVLQVDAVHDSGINPNLEAIKNSFNNLQKSLVSNDTEVVKVEFIDAQYVYSTNYIGE